MSKKMFGILMPLALLTLPLCVNAEVTQPSDFNDSKNVTVGDVETTFYSVDIEWDDLSFDWKYDQDAKEFGFEKPQACQGVIASERFLPMLTSGSKKVYVDDTCSTLNTDEIQSGNTYYTRDGLNPSVNVVDNSVNGKIKAKVEFTSANSYNWVIGKFYKSYNLMTGKLEYQDELTDGYLPAYQLTGSRRLYGYLKLDVDSEYTGEKTIETGATLGSVTLEISKDED